MTKRNIPPADTALADFRESAGLTAPPRTLSNAASRLVDLLDDYLRVLGIGWEIPPGFPADRFVPSVCLAEHREGPIVQYLVDLRFTGDARRVHEAIQRCLAIRDCRIMRPRPDDDEGWQQFQQRYVNPLSYRVARLRQVIYETRQLIITMGTKWAAAQLKGAPGKSKSEGKAGTSTKKRRGRQLETDPKEDKRIADDWRVFHNRTGGTYEDFGRGLGLSGYEVKKAVDRDSKRPARRRKNSGR